MKKSLSKTLVEKAVLYRSTGSGIGVCSEFNAANNLLFKKPKFNFRDFKISTAVRPKSMKVIPMCKNTFK